MKHLRRITAFVLLLCLLPLSACKGDRAGNSDTKIEMDVQEYESGNIAEIPKITYDTTRKSLKKTGGKNPQIDFINSDIKNNFKANYERFIKDSRKGYVDIRTYPFSDDRYIQLVISYNEYPVYGTDGVMRSYCFDKAANKLITAEERLRQDGITLDELKKKAEAAFTPEFEGDKADDVGLSGFVILDGKTIYLLNLMIKNDNAVTRIVFYSYDLKQGTLKRLNRDRLFDRELLLHLDPPLCYDREQTQEGRTHTAELKLTAENLKQNADGSFSLESKTVFTVSKSEPVPPFIQEIIGLVEKAESGGIYNMTSEYSFSLTEKLEYPVWLIKYDTAPDGKGKKCMDIVLQTDSNAFRIHSVTDVRDFSKMSEKITAVFESAKLESAG